MNDLHFAAETAKARWRVDTLRTKEPETVAWVESMPAGSVFWDIGANIGIYSLLAARRGIMTVAIEPLPANYAALCRAILDNGLSETVLPLGMGLSNKNCASFIEFAANEAGNTTGVGQQIGVLKTTIDSLAHLFELPPPTHIKIDTDGSDFRVLCGAVESLERAQSVIIETRIGTDERNWISGLLTEAGFSMTGRHVCPLYPKSPVGMDHWHRPERNL